MKTQEMKLNSEQQLKIKKKRKKKLARILFWLKTVMLVSLTLTVLVLLGLSPLFNINKIEVKGNQHYPSEEIEKTTGIIIGSNGFKSIGSSLKNVFTLRFGEAEHILLESKPYIKQVKVRYVLPGTVRVTVIERKPVAAVEFMGNKVMVDKDGYALESLPDNAKRLSDNTKSLTESAKNLSYSTKILPHNIKNLPVLLGLEIKHYEFGQAVKFHSKSDLEGFDSAVELLLAIIESDELTATDKLYGLINSVDISDQDNIMLGINGRFKVNFGHLQDMEHNLNFFRNIYYSVLKNSNNRGILDMTAKDPVLKDE